MLKPYFIPTVVAVMIVVMMMNIMVPTFIYMTIIIIIIIAFIHRYASVFGVPSVCWDVYECTCVHVNVCMCVPHLYIPRQNINILCESCIPL